MVVFAKALTLLLGVSSVGALLTPKPSLAPRSILHPRRVSTSEEVDVVADADADPDSSASIMKQSCEVPPFTNVMAANRAEIAVRIMRAATELNSGTVAIYCHEDRYSQHRWGADRSYLLEKEDDATPISTYLDIPQIIKIAKDANADAIHPGYVHTHT